jgi:predicted Zn-dependent protease
MTKPSTDNLFRRGVDLLRDNNSLGALACFEKAYHEIKSPELQSYLAFCIAVERGQTSEAVNMCSNAISREPDNPVHYLNLGRIYLKAGMKEKALMTLRNGLSAGHDEEILSLLDTVGKRKKPVFSFLSRRNFINKYLGIILHRLGLR